MDTKEIRQKWTAALAVKAHEVAVKPAELAALVAEGVPDELALPTVGAGCTHVLLTKAQVEAILSHERTSNEAVTTDVTGQSETDLDD